MSLQSLVKSVRTASYSLSLMSTSDKNKVLKSLAKELLAKESQIIKANKLDLASAQKAGVSPALLDRLTLTKERIRQMAQGVIEIAKLPDPVGTILEKRNLDNGLLLKRVSVPIGVIAIIYEARPNVTIDAAALCFKSGNAVILRGGSDAYHSNSILGKILASCFPPGAVLLAPKDRKSIGELIKLDKYIDVVIPRGGEGLIRFVVENSTIPVIMHYKGVCSVYVDKNADLKMAEKIIINSKCHRPGVCNAAENLILHKQIAKKFLPRIQKTLQDNNVDIVGCPKTRKIIKVPKAKASDWSTEYLSLKVSIKTVESIEEAVNFINEYGSGHTESIVTKDAKAARFFTTACDSSTVFWNASTRFTDGAMFGMGAEMGISTQKLHARGPMALKELTSYKYIVKGRGHVR